MCDARKCYHLEHSSDDPYHHVIQKKLQQRLQVFRGRSRWILRFVVLSGALFLHYSASMIGVTVAEWHHTCTCAWYVHTCTFVSKLPTLLLLDICAFPEGWYTLILTELLVDASRAIKKAAARADAKSSDPQRLRMPALAESCVAVVIVHAHPLNLQHACTVFSGSQTRLLRSLTMKIVLSIQTASQRPCSPCLITIESRRAPRGILQS